MKKLLTLLLLTFAPMIGAIHDGGEGPSEPPTKKAKPNLAQDCDDNALYFSELPDDVQAVIAHNFLLSRIKEQKWLIEHLPKTGTSIVENPPVARPPLMRALTMLNPETSLSGRVIATHFERKALIASCLGNELTQHRYNVDTTDGSIDGYWVHPDEQHIVIKTTQGLSVWYFKENRIVPLANPQGSFFDLLFSSNGQFAACTSTAGLTVYEINTADPDQPYTLITTCASSADDPFSRPKAIFNDDCSSVTYGDSKINLTQNPLPIVSYNRPLVIEERERLIVAPQEPYAPVYEVQHTMFARRHRRQAPGPQWVNIIKHKPCDTIEQYLYLLALHDLNKGGESELFPSDQESCNQRNINLTTLRLAGTTTLNTFPPETLLKCIQTLNAARAQFDLPPLLRQTAATLEQQLAVPQ